MRHGVYWWLKLSKDLGAWYKLVRGNLDRYNLFWCCFYKVGAWSQKIRIWLYSWTLILTAHTETFHNKLRWRHVSFCWQWKAVPTALELRQSYHFVVPSICHTALGRGAEYTLRFMTWDGLQTVLAWSVRWIAERNLALGTLIPKCSKWPCSITSPVYGCLALTSDMSWSSSDSKILVKLLVSMPFSCSHRYNVWREILSIRATLVHE